MRMIMIVKINGIYFSGQQTAATASLHHAMDFIWLQYPADLIGARFLFQTIYTRNILV